MKKGEHVARLACSRAFLQSIPPADRQPWQVSIEDLGRNRGELVTTLDSRQLQTLKHVRRQVEFVARCLRVFTASRLLLRSRSIHPRRHTFRRRQSR